MPIRKKDWKDCATELPETDAITGASCMLVVYTSFGLVKSAYYNKFRQQWVINGGHISEVPVKWVKITYP